MPASVGVDKPRRTARDERERVISVLRDHLFFKTTS